MAKIRNEHPFQTIAGYYGFEPFAVPSLTPDDEKLVRKIKKGTDVSRHENRFPLEEKVAFIRSFLDNEQADKQQPALFCHEPVFGNKKETSYALHIFNTKKSIAEAIIMKASLAILEHAGVRQPLIKINCIGNKDTIPRLAREMQTHCRKIMGDLDTEGRDLLKKGPHTLLSSPAHACFCEQFPSPLNYLNEECRSHFREVLEYLERNEIAYEIDHRLLGSNFYSSETVFEIVDIETGNHLVTGSRHNYLTRRLGHKKDIPSIGALIHIPAQVKEPVKAPRKNTELFFIQLGFEAKLKSLQVIDMLRKARIPVEQSLSRDRISTQLGLAEKSGIPYVIIMGQQEALRNSVLIRHMATRSQETVEIDNLVPFLRHHLKSR